MNTLASNLITIISFLFIIGIFVAIVVYTLKYSWNVTVAKFKLHTKLLTITAVLFCAVMLIVFLLSILTGGI
jgi:hypothetical protein